MKKCLILLLVPLFSLSACKTTKRHTIQVTDHQSETTDSLSLATDSIVSVRTSSDTLSLSAALQAQQTETGTSSETDSSRTVIVTEFGPDGLPVRQTETRQNAISRQSSWSNDLQLQIESYMQYMSRLDEEYTDFMRQVNEYKNDRLKDLSVREEQRETTGLSLFAKWMIALEYFLLFAFILFAAYYYLKKR